MFEKVLIANRGEIAVRVIHTCKRLGVRTVAVHSTADRGALHVRLADEAVEIGQPPASASYLNAQRLIAAAKATGAQAIHPGYGFLSENADFAKQVQEAGLVWIGPSPQAIAQMGDKLAAREMARAAGVPLVPGSEALASVELAKKAAQKIGYPVLLKAKAGGGGKGMRVVDSSEQMPAAFERARSEAMRSFGNPDLYLEKYVPNAKHIEMQVFSDAHGNHLWLGERECSIQRRHQKLIEESPSAALREPERKQMGEAAVALARNCGYANAGTVEYLYDADAKTFYFLEMNTRLQVEHPVTELVTGLDLVEWQLRVACGEPLPLQQKQIEHRGVAIQCRLYAEDPHDFLPATGRLHVYLPPTGPGVRLDSGVIQGDSVTSHYDPLLAKLIVHGKDRSKAVERMKRALDEFVIAGVTTNLAYHSAVMDAAEFQAGTHLTHFVQNHPLPRGLDPDHAEALARAAGQWHHARLQQMVLAQSAGADGWPELRGLQ